jgi:carboxyl-terminal processing protease
VNRRFNLLFVSVSSVAVALLLVGTVMGRAASAEDPYKHLAVFTEVLSRIKSDYVEEPDLKSVTMGAVNGLLESIDPYASYLTADQYKQWVKQKDVKRADVGLIISKRFGYIGVVDSIPGSPAAKAGLNTGDMLESIKGIATRDMPLAYAELLMRGDAGSTLELSVRRVRRPESEKLTLTRAAAKYPAVSSKMLADQTGYLVVATLEPGKSKELAAAVVAMEKQGAKRLIVDFRDCALGAPEEGVHVANLFMESGLIGYLQGQRVNRQNFEAAAARQVTKLPMAVLTNRGTAGGAEVAASALLDSKRAQVVGERTYGDAAVRKTITLDDGSAVILAVAKYYSPSGKAIQDNSVVPGVTVSDQPEPQPDTEEEVAAPEPAVERPRNGDDAVVKKALEVLAAAKN